VTEPSALSSAPAPFTSHELRGALGRFTTGVTIITTRSAEGAPVGLTANSFNSVSMHPPLVLWSLSMQAGTFGAFRDCTHFAIHVLSAEQRALAERFAARGVDRFADTVWHEGVGGAPLLDGCVARFECSSRQGVDAGDHRIFIGEVLSCTQDPELRPLVFHSGHFYTDLPLPPARPHG
jgi:flavin reductase (DIM6/NTAB) family NADH-FMN oxidoreductase RutF